MASGGKRNPSAWILTIVLATLLVVPLGLGPTARARPPTLPVALDSRFLTNLSAPELAPGTSESIGFVLANPLNATLTQADLLFEVYAFNPYPGNPATADTGGNGTGIPGGTPTPTLAIDFQAGSRVAAAIGSLAPGARYTSPLTISAPGNAPDGTFAIRTALTFTVSATAYRLESRGFISAADWSNATAGGNGTLNLSRLPVSGVLPETAVLVRTNDLALPLYGVLVAALVLAGAGGYFAWRKGPGSRSGARGAPDDSKAPNALGNSRSSEGD